MQKHPSPLNFSRFFKSEVSPALPKQKKIPPLAYRLGRNDRGSQNVGRDDRLWHLECRYLPNVVSQSPRIQLTLNSVIRTPVANKNNKALGGPGVLPWSV